MDSRVLKRVCQGGSFPQAYLLYTNQVSIDSLGHRTTSHGQPQHGSANDLDLEEIRAIHVKKIIENKVIC